MLVVGSSSFAAMDTVERLRGMGHVVWTFDRRKQGARSDYALVGRPAEIADAVGAIGKCDVLINYFLLKGASMQANVEFCRGLAVLAERMKVRRLIHISSIIVAAAKASVVDESTPVERNTRHRPPYSRLKIETELEIRKCVTSCEVVIVRPGFIIGSGLADPMPGIGRRLAAGHILAMGSRKSVIPLISREILDRAIGTLLDLPLDSRETIVQLTDSGSPRREEYLEFCCGGLGMGRSTWFFPAWLWRGALLLASPAAAVRRGRWQNLSKAFVHNLAIRRYDSGRSEKLLDFHFSSSWRELLRAACGRQHINFIQPTFGVQTVTEASTSTMVLVGAGRIVQERHIPALESMRYRGLVEWYDPHVTTLRHQSTLNFRRLSRLSDSTAECAVVATPASVRAEVARDLPWTVRRILWEKPYAISAPDYAALCLATAERRGYVVHNYRYKWNVRKLFEALNKWNPGELRHTRLHFDSPSVEVEQAAWLKNERVARTLVMDYALHFVDLMLIFSKGPGEWRSVSVAGDARGATAEVTAFGHFENQSCSIFLRQGARQRRCEIEYIFQNYSFRLRFFPESAVLFMGGSGFASDIAAAWHETGAFGRKVLEKTKFTAMETSHRDILAAFLGQRPLSDIEQLRLDRLGPCYESILKLADIIYGADIETIGHVQNRERSAEENRPSL